MGYWWLPVRRVWLGVASRFGVRQTGKAAAAVMWMWPSVPACDRSRRAWSDSGVAFAFFAGLWRLRQEVSTCEYEDVHVMWEMLSRTTAAPKPAPRRHSRFRPQPRPWTDRLRLCRGF
jgi:hypothetical protein